MAEVSVSSSVDMQTRYAQRLVRYTTAMRNEMPDCVPIRPFVAEFTGNYAGYTCQELAHDYRKAFEAAARCAADFDWDAVVPNMVYVWTGLVQALGLKYYAIPGIDIPPTTGFQYREPPQNKAFMEADEYDALIEDPTGFLYNVWLPRVSEYVSPIGESSTFENNLALVKGSMAVMDYFGAFGPHIGRLRCESGTVSAISGILKAPMDIIADKLRGYLGLVEDLFERRDKVVAACEALAPHLCHVARTTADPACNVPVGFWMHRGGVPFVSFEIFENIYWATLKPIIQELWAAGHQTLFYAEGNWDPHLETFKELPDRSIVYHVDQGDVFKAHEVLGEKFCLSGGIPNTMLSIRSPGEVRDLCKEVIERVACDGGYVMDASAIIQNDAKVENVRAMTDAAREFGVYSRGHATAMSENAENGTGLIFHRGHQGLSQESDLCRLGPAPLADDARPGAFLANPSNGKLQPGECIAWEKKREQLPAIKGDEQVCRDVWQNVDALGNMFIWQVLLSF